MPFPWVFKRYFDRVAMLHREYTQDWEQCRRNVPGVPQHYTVPTFHRSKPRSVCHSKLANGCFTILFDGAYFLLAVMVEGDESSQPRVAN